MPILIQNCGWERKDNLYLRNTQGLSGYASATLITNISEVKELNGFFRADANTVGMPIPSQNWTIMCHSFNSSYPANIIAQTCGATKRTFLGFYTTSSNIAWSEVTVVGHGHAQNEITNLVADLALKAPLANPVLTGEPKAPTASVGTATTQIATTKFVDDSLPTIKYW